ncbi:hypothetical protein [Thermococcus camini]|nr:hypothetical protein [Thermococcus camini]
MSMMRRKAGLLGAVVGAVMVLLLVGVVVTALALHGDIHIEGITPRKDAGPLRELGRFDAGAVIVKNVVGKVQLISSDVSGVVVKSNLPVNATYQNGLLTVYCLVEKKRSGFGISTHNLCEDYKNGRIIIEVGNGLSDVWVQNTVGDVFIGANATRVVIENTVGDVVSSAPAEYRVDDVVGDVSIHAEGDVTINDVVGDIGIRVPPNYTVSLSLDDVLGKVEKAHSGEGRPIIIRISNVVGDVSVGQ